MKGLLSVGAHLACLVSFVREGSRAPVAVTRLAVLFAACPSWMAENCPWPG